LRIISSLSGSGDGSFQFNADGNSDPTLRQGLLSLGNGQQHWVYQDGAGALLGLSPLAATPCGTQVPEFGVSWFAQGNVEIHLGSPGGQLVGQFGPAGTTLLPQIGDGTFVYLTAPGASPVLASAEASVLAANCAAPQVSPQGVANSASLSQISIAPGSFATIFGTNLSSATVQASGVPYPNTLGGITVSLSGMVCPLQYVSATQVNFVVPSSLPTGRYLLTVNSATADAIVTNTSPGIFTLNGDGTGVPNGSLIAVMKDGSSVPITPYQCSSGGCTIVPVSLPNNLASLYIVLYGTGIRNAMSISAELGGFAAQVVYFGQVPAYPGLDQVNLLITNPTGLTGHESLALHVDGVSSNAVDLLFQ
jgi:uncharacterized protein (TIGR03437 family)